MEGSAQVEVLKRAAELIYDQNVSILLSKARLAQQEHRSIWRVEMDHSGIVTACTKCVRIEKPQPNTFLFIVPEKGKLPVFGNFRGLHGHQIAIAQALKSDVARLLQTSEVAYCLSKTAPSAALQNGMRDLADRFGELPVPSQQLVLEREQKRLASGAASREKMEDLVKSIPRDVFEQYVAKERKLMEKQRKARSRRTGRVCRAKRHSSPTPLLGFSYRYFSFHYLLNNQRYQYIQVYTQPQ